MHLDVLFTLLVQAAQDYYKNGMPKESEEMLKHKEQMISEIDSVSQWLASGNVFTKDDPGVLEVYEGDIRKVKAIAKDARANYKAFCHDNGFKARSITGRMKQLGHEEYPVNGKHYFKGIVLEEQFRADQRQANQNTQSGGTNVEMSAYFQ